MSLICFTCWMVFAGWMSGIETSWHQQADMDGPYFELQTSRDGLGAHLKAGTSAWVTGGLHYGMSREIGHGITVTVQPGIGLGYFNNIHPNGYRQIGRFEVGLGLLVSKDSWTVGCEYIHISNGQGTHPGNVGMDGWGCKAGVRL